MSQQPQDQSIYILRFITTKSEAETITHEMT